MKITIILVTLLISAVVFSQEIKTEKGNFFSDGKQISNKEVKTLLASNTDALALYKSSRTKASIGGFLIGFGGGLIIADLIVGLNADVKYPTAATYVGLASLITSIPVLSGKNKKMTDAITLYNDGLKKLSKNDSNFELNIIANQNGYGLQFQF